MGRTGHLGQGQGASGPSAGPALRGGAVADLRRDRLTGITSLVVPEWETEKEANPDLVALELPVGTVPCPFCPPQMDDGRARAGEETERVPGRQRHPGWSAVALRNRWPHTVAPDAAEVVVVSDLHDTHLGDLDLDEATEAFGLLLRRAAFQRAAGRFPLVFVNHGVNAGSSQPHPHGQVVGLPVPDPGSAREAAALGGPRCVLCEEPPRDRVVAQVPGASVIVPEAPAVDYDQTVVLDGHGPVGARAVAAAVRVALRSLFAVTGPVAYNLVLHEAGHPHVHVTPRSARHSGYELAGIRTCYVDPALAAERLRRAARSVDGFPPAAATGREREPSGQDEQNDAA